MFEGKKVAFIATGGGGKGIAHIGVMKACHKMGIKFDMLIGASAGAIASIFYAQYKDLDKILDNFRPAKKRKYKFKPFGWRRMVTFKNFFNKRLKSGLFSLDGAEEFFKENLITDSFDELQIPTYVSVTNLNKNAGVLLGPGIEPAIPISKALAASCCLPVLFRPVKIGDDYYVDGEIKRPLSIQSAISLGAEVIIVSDMYAQPPSVDYGTLGMVDIFSQIVNMMFEDKSHRGIQFCQSKYPDKEIVLISPSTSKVSAFNTFAYRKLMNAGYNTGIKILREYEEKNG